MAYYAQKSDYSQSINKRAVQHAIFKSLKVKHLTNLVGLAGPNITEYLILLKSHGIKQAEIYEYDISKLAIQLENYQPVIKSQIKFSDVLHAEPNKQDTLYDLDFCCSINGARMHISKFTDNVVYTLSIRPIGLDETVKQFSKLTDGTLNPEFELVKAVHSPQGKYKCYNLELKTKKYTCYVYKDTVPMLTIQSIS